MVNSKNLQTYILKLSIEAADILIEERRLREAEDSKFLEEAELIQQMHEA